MKSRSDLRTVVMLAIMVVPLFGCNKMLANFSLNNASKNLEKARTEYDAERHVGAEVLETENEINTARSMIINGDTSGARTKAKDAAVLAKDLLARSKQLHANYLKSEANRWIGYADLNAMRPDNPNAYDKIQEANADGTEAYNSEDWEDAVEEYGTAVRESQFLLEDLTRRAEQGLAEVMARRDGLEAEGTPEFYPEGITELEDNIKRIEEMIVDKFDFRSALSRRDVAIRAAEDAIKKTKEAKSDRLLREIETALRRATDLGAEIHVPDMFSEVSEKFEDILTLHFDAKYESVLITGPKLLPETEDLIVQTRKEDARKRLLAVSTAIENLEDGMAREHLPGQLEELEKIHAEAKAQFDSASYEEAKTTCSRGLEEERKIILAFDRKTGEEISEASRQLNSASAVFDRMAEIFDVEPARDPNRQPPAMDSKAVREELRSLRDAARLELGLLDLKREERKFDHAIDSARNVVALSEQLSNGVFGVVSHHSLTDMGVQISALEKDGGRMYAAMPLDAAIGYWSQARGLHAEKKYRDALTLSSKSQAELEKCRQELERRAVQNIEDASRTITQLEEFRGDEFQAAPLIQARSNVREARARLETGGLKEPIEIADQARQIAERAVKDSLRQWAEEDMALTDKLLARAREAGAASYAADMMDEAVNLRRNAEALFDAGDFREAQLTAGQAALTARNALYALVIQAEDEIARAKLFGGWDYEWERLHQAIMMASQARSFMEQGQYPTSRQYAEGSWKLARNVTIDAKKASFHDRITQLNARVEEAGRQGAGYLLAGDISRIVGDMNELATNFTPDGYEDSARSIELLETQVAGLVEMTPGVLQDIVGNLNTRLAEMEDRGARLVAPDLVAQVNREIGYAQQDFRNEKYRPSYENLRAAISTLGELDLRLHEREYDTRLSGLFDELSDVFTSFAPVLNAGSPVLAELANQPEGRSRAISVLNKMDPTEFRQSIADIEMQVSLLEPPSTREGIHNAAIDTMREASAGASGFEKLLILDQYPLKEARTIIHEAFLRLRSARSRQQEIQSRLEFPQTVSPGETSVRRALSVRSQ